MQCLGSICKDIIKDNKIDNINVNSFLHKLIMNMNVDINQIIIYNSSIQMKIDSQS